MLPTSIRENMTSIELEDFKIFKTLPKNLIYQIKQKHFPIVLEQGDYIIKKGIQNQALHFLLEGKAEVYLDEKDKPIKILQPGSMVGEISFIDNNPATASIICLSSCKIVVIYETVLWELIHKNHDFTISLLQLVVNHFRGLNLQLEASNAQRRLSERHANIDDLTGLYNRGWLNKKFELLLGRCKKDQHPFSYFMIDIDNFKKVNDTYGHQTGDIVLQQTADTLTQLARAEDYVVRFGGEEMAILLPNTEMADAIVFAERIRKNIEDTHFEFQLHKALRITVSIGVSSLINDETSIDLIRLADEALYYAKSHGRNQIKGDTSNSTTS